MFAAESPENDLLKVSLPLHGNNMLHHAPLADFYTDQPTTDPINLSLPALIDLYVTTHALHGDRLLQRVD